MLTGLAQNRPVAGWHFDNTFARLPEIFFARLRPVPVSRPRLVAFNRELADELGLDVNVLESEEGAGVFGGNELPEGAEPIAQAYAGHQFGVFTMLGDGRAILLGEQQTPDGRRVDIQLKGAGRTPFSRNGDGRGALGPMLREYIVSEAMHALGVPTTRSLAVVTTGEAVLREDALDGAILTRVASSHLRVGTFENIAARNQTGHVRTLADYAIQRHYAALAGADNPYLALLCEVAEQQAALVARWQLIGFIHGVMNTDNMSLCGETIDYGPCAFMDAYDPGTVFSSIDRHGRYAYGNQPPIAQWNLARFAETLLPLLHEDPKKSLALAQEALGAFPETFRRRWLGGMRAKLGLFTEEAQDADLVQTLLDAMHRHGADYTNTFRDLCAVPLPDAPFFRTPAFGEWHGRWQARLDRQGQPIDASRERMRGCNPAVIPRNQRVEEALAAAVERDDYGVMQRLVEVLARPYRDRPPDDLYRQPPPPSGRPYVTFCGT